jgi:tetratricopeptide (TPR) repeat protein
LEQLLQNVAESAEALVPGSIQSLVLARMDRLDPADKRALQAASVFGQRFSLAALRHLTGTPAYDPAELLRHQLVRPEGEDFLFAHALVRDGVYESILSAPRARLHLKAADLFAATDPVLHARHLEMASSPETSRAYIRASESESAHHRPAIALELAERATTAAATPEDELSAAILRARLLVDLGRFADAILHWDTAIELATDLSMRGRALLGKAEALRLGNRSEDALVILDEAEQLLERTEQGNSLAWLSHLRGNLFFTLGQSEECLSHHQKALDLARANGFADVEVAALGGLGDAMYALGSIESSLKYFDDCVQKASNIGAKRSEAANLPMAAVTRFFSLDLEPALRDVERAIDLSHRIGHLRAEFIARSVIDFLLFERCERAELERNHLICRKLVEKLDAKVFRAFVHEQAAKSLELAQDPEAARKELSAALEILGERSMIFAGPRVLAHAAMTSECANEAVALIDRALLELSNGALAHNHLTAYRDAIDVALRWGLWDRAEDHIDAFEQFRSQEALDWREYFVKRGRALLELGKGRNYDAVCETLDPMLDAAMRKSWAFEIVALGGALEAARRGSPWRLPSRSMLASAGCQLES